MSTMLDILRLAVVSAEGTRIVPDGDDGALALQRAQGMIDALPGLRTGAWVDVILTSSTPYAAKDGERVIANGFAPIITLPAVYTDDCGVTKAQRDLSRVQVIDDGLYVYASSNGAWRRADGLTLKSDFPFGPEDEQGFAALWAVALAADAGSTAELSPAVITIANAQLQSFTARLAREVSVRVDPAFLRMSDTGRYGYCR